MSVSIDELVIGIDSDASKALQGLKSMVDTLNQVSAPTETAVKSLKKLKKVLESINGLSVNVKWLSELTNALKDMSEFDISNLKKLPNALKKLSEVDIASLVPQIQALADAMRPL